MSVRVGNAGDRDGTEIVQLYLHDPVASVVRPVQRLIAFARIPLAAGAAARCASRFPPTWRASPASTARRIVEPGEIVLGFGRSSGDIVQEVSVRLTGEVRGVDHTRALHAEVVVEAV